MGASVSQECEVTLRFYPPPEHLRRYFTTFYHIDWVSHNGQPIEDYLLPEWSNFRFQNGGIVDGKMRCGKTLGDTSFAVTGHTSTAIRVTTTSCRMWGFGLLPLGWAKFLNIPAAELADTAVDGNTHPAFTSFRELADTLFQKHADESAEYQRLLRHFEARSDKDIPDESRIIAIHEAVVDRGVASVSDITEATGMTSRTIERMCKRYFGFSPKLLIRRQRFMRSLTDYLMDPSMKWIGAIDSQYHDQAQFVRDFRQFIGMSPRQYAKLDKPLIPAILRARAALGRPPMQILDEPKR